MEETYKDACPDCGYHQDDCECDMCPDCEQPEEDCECNEEDQ